MKVRKLRKRKGKSCIHIINVQGKATIMTLVILVGKVETYYVVTNVQLHFIFNVSKLKDLLIILSAVHLQKVFNFNVVLHFSKIQEKFVLLN